MRQLISQSETSIKDIEALKKWVSGLKSNLRPREVILLSGNLGSGKTQLVRAFVESVGVDEEAASPSFAIHNSYHAKSIGSIEHLDLYRLESADDLESTGFWDLFDRDQGYIFIEWADRLEKEALPLAWPLREIHLEVVGTTRHLTEKVYT